MQSLTISETQLVSGSGFTKVMAISGAVIGSGIGAAMSFPYAVLGLMVGFEGVLLSGVFFMGCTLVGAGTGAFVGTGSGLTLDYFAGKIGYSS